MKAHFGARELKGAAGMLSTHVMRPVRAAVVAIMSVFLLIGSFEPANAHDAAVYSATPDGLFDDYCAGEPDTLLITYYKAQHGTVTVPLRCGVKTSWGYREINNSTRDGWTASFDTRVEYTLQNGLANDQGDGVFLYDNAGFIVIVDTNQAPGGGQYGISQAGSLGRVAKESHAHVDNTSWPDSSTP